MNPSQAQALLFEALVIIVFCIQRVFYYYLDSSCKVKLICSPYIQLQIVGKLEITQMLHLTRKIL